MNERVKKLMATIPTDTSGRWVHIGDIEKYTELVVKECSHLVFTRNHRTEPAEYIYLLKEFGVKDE